MRLCRSLKSQSSWKVSGVTVMEVRMAGKMTSAELGTGRQKIWQVLSGYRWSGEGKELSHQLFGKLGDLKTKG